MHHLGLFAAAFIARLIAVAALRLWKIITRDTPQRKKREKDGNQDDWLPS